MQATYHIQLTTQALRKDFHPAALEVVLAANLGQDSLRRSIGHPEYHFDDSQFEKGLAYLEEQRRIILHTLRKPPGGDSAPALSAWQAFGRLLHAVQDFYAHSNYAALWVRKFRMQYGETYIPDPESIDPLEPSILGHPELRSGRSYLPLEALTIFPRLVPLVKPFLPRDSHAWMNLDGPGQGPLFPYALSAAGKRTRLEYDRIAAPILHNLGPGAFSSFTGRFDALPGGK
jgi:hypothetical protein